MAAARSGFIASVSKPFLSELQPAPPDGGWEVALLPVRDWRRWIARHSAVRCGPDAGDRAGDRENVRAKWMGHEINTRSSCRRRARCTQLAADPMPLRVALLLCVAFFAFGCVFMLYTGAQYDEVLLPAPSTLRTSGSFFSRLRLASFP